MIVDLGDGFRLRSLTPLSPLAHSTPVTMIRQQERPSKQASNPKDPRKGKEGRERSLHPTPVSRQSVENLEYPPGQRSINPKAYVLSTIYTLPARF